MVKSSLAILVMASGMALVGVWSSVANNTAASWSRPFSDARNCRNWGPYVVMLTASPVVQVDIGVGDTSVVAIVLSFLASFSPSSLPSIMALSLADISGAAGVASTVVLGAAAGRSAVGRAAGAGAGEAGAGGPSVGKAGATLLIIFGLIRRMPAKVLRILAL